jgi:hypothetical protein
MERQVEVGERDVGIHARLRTNVAEFQDSSLAFSQDVDDSLCRLVKATARENE